MTGIYRMRFKGFLDRKAFGAALSSTVKRHPFLRATVRHVSGRRSVWIDHPDWCPVVQWQARVKPSGFPIMSYLDLTQEPGNRWWVLERDDGHDVIIQAHHCCMDGAGADVMVEDLLVGYALSLGSDDNNLSLRPLDPQRLLWRGTPKLTMGKGLELIRDQLLGLGTVRDFFHHEPTPLMADDSFSDSAADTPDTFPAIHTYEFNSDDTQRISAEAKRMHVTVNTLLIRDLFMTLGMWRAKRGIGSEEDTLRLSIPINLRSPADKQMPVCNAISLVFFDRQGRDRAYPDPLLKGIYEQMWAIKRLQLRYNYILGVGVVRLLPGMMSRMARADKCYATSYFSNLGKILGQAPLPRRQGRLVSGNVVLESVDALSVLRPHTNAGFVACIYNGRLRIAMQYDSRAIPAEASRELLEMYGKQIHQSIQENRHSS